MGNQMFQYAFALQVLKRNSDHKIVLNGCFHPFSLGKRPLSMQHFELAEHTHFCPPLKRYGLFLRMILAAFSQMGIRGTFRTFRHIKATLAAHREQLCDAGLYIWTDIYSLPNIRRHSSGGCLHLFGFYQHPQVIRGIEEPLRKAFTIKTPPSKANQEMLERIRQDNAVCLHVRRGDYTLLSDTPVCDEAYYRKAVQDACAKLDHPVFYVFSTGHEDVEWVRRHYRFDAEMHYVDLDNPDYEELRLMMACKHFIIANSTFSWWAAVLSNAAGAAKQVWAPAEWWRGSGINMALDEWITLRTDES